MPTEMDSTICTSRSRPDCLTVSIAIAATPRSRTSPTDAGVAVLDDTAQSLFADVDNDGDQDLVVATSTGLLLFVNDGKGRFVLVADAFRLAQPFQGVLTSIAMADYDRDGFLDLYVCVYSYLFGAGEDKAGTPAPYYDARNGPPSVLFRNDGHGRFIDVTAEAGLDIGNDHYHFAAAWADYDGDGWPDLLVANDFGTKNLYRNLGRRNGTVKFEDVAASAGLLDHGAGMSATFLDYDNDGLLDIYAGNMWSAPGLRITSAPTFMPDAPPDVRALFRRHVRGNSLFRNLGNGRFEDKTLEAHAEMGRWAWSSDALDFDSDGWDDLYVVNGMLTRKAPATGERPRGLLLAAGRGPLTAHARARHAVRRCVACDQSAVDSRFDRQPAAQRLPPQRRTRRLRRDLRDGRPRPRSGRPIVCGARHRRRWRSGPRRDGRSTGAAASRLPKRLRDGVGVDRRASARNQEQPRRDRCPRDGRDRSRPEDAGSCSPAPGSCRSIRKSW